MKFLCLCYYDTVAFSLLDAEEIEEVGRACRPHDAALKATGRIVAQGSLSAPDGWSYFIARDGTGRPHCSLDRPARFPDLIRARDLRRRSAVRTRPATA